MAVRLSQEQGEAMSRFTLETMADGSPIIWDDDFGWDASIRVGGDFYGPDKEWFMEAIVAALNAANLPTRKEWEAANPELARKIMAGEDA